MADQEPKSTRKLPDRDDSTQTEHWKREEELARQVPSDTQPAEERGERLSTGKTIAHGGHPEGKSQ
jgi:hypothetical protein